MSSAVSTLLRRTARPAYSPLVRPFSSTPHRPDETSNWVTANILYQKPKTTTTTTPGTTPIAPTAPSHPPPASPNPALWSPYTGSFNVSDILIAADGINDPLINPPPVRPRYKNPVRLAPSTGRTVHVSSTMDAATALRVLNTRVRQNGLQKLTRLQRFHERPGLKRKRLKSERWRSRFRQSFLATVARVQELTKQGW